jgi:hypothetical protein
MNLYENIFDILWEHWVKFEMNTMIVGYSKMFYNNVTNVFFLQKRIKKSEII